MTRIHTTLALALSGLLLVTSGCWSAPRQGMQRSRLPDAQEIQGTPCAKGHAWFYDSGRLNSCELSRDARVNGVALPARSTVFFDETGTLDFCWLSETADIQGFACYGRGHQTMTGFYPSGRLKYFWPPADLVVDGVPCKSTGFAGVYLHENGRLERCRLSRATRIQEIEFRAGADVRFDEYGWLVRG